MEPHAIKYNNYNLHYVLAKKKYKLLPRCELGDAWGEDES